MLPNQSSKTESSGSYGAYERQPYPTGFDARSHERERAPIELPRPGEAHIDYQPQYYSPDQNSRIRQDPGAPQLSAPPAAPSRGPSLPGLRDILSPQSQDSGRPVFPSGQRDIHHHRNDSLQNPSNLHPPLALNNTHHHHHHHRHHQAYQPRETTSQDARHPPQALAISPYPSQFGSPTESRDLSYARPRQDSSVSHVGQMHNAASPFTPFTGDERQQYNFPASIIHERQASAGLPPVPIAESQGKYLGVREIPGEGQFHVYESGTRIPTYVDGEQVNPAWGLTKANKPRKRLAAACLDCRDKKIKCEPGPGNSSCLQCEKAKRTCRRPQNTPSTTDVSSNWSASASSPPRNHGSTDPTPSTGRHTDADQSLRRRQREADQSMGTALKKHRSHSPLARPSSVSSTILGSHALAHTVSDSAADTSYGYMWDRDPFVEDSTATMEMLELYFAYVNDSMYPLLPRRPFLNWVTTATEKGPFERMAVYAMIAVGSLFTTSHQYFARLAVEAVTSAVNSKEGKFSSSLAQSRFLLALYHFAKGNEGAAWDYCGAAIRVAYARRLNTEDGCMHGLKRDEQHCGEFDLSIEQIAESRRRTFWSIFLMDRLIGFCCGTQCTINPKDIFLRLPVSDDIFHGGLPSHAPLFNNGITDASRTVLTAASHVSPSGWLVLGAAIYGDVLTFLSRSVNRAPKDYTRAYEEVYQATEIKMSGWLSRFPSNLQYNLANLERSIKEGYGGAFIELHTFHHFTVMKLNRWARHSLIPNSVARNIRTAHNHARQFLEMMRDIQSINENFASPGNRLPDALTYMNAFTGYATFSAIDIVAAGGPDESLGSIIALIETGLEALRALSSLWKVVRPHLSDGQKRLLQIRNVVARPANSKSGCWLGRSWGMEKPMESEFGLEDDCIYGVADHVYFTAFTEGIRANRQSSGSIRIA